MPFPMVHLNIARKILNNAPHTILHRDFYVGSLAPDSVHFRPNYSGIYKVKSHICIDSWKWGESTENDAWTENVIRFLKSNCDSMNYSFICGYCAHILADIAWNRKFWLPFRASHAIATGNLNGSGLHQECYEIDTHLFHQLIDKKKIWELLENCVGFEITGVVSASETVKMVNSILYEQFSNRSIDQKYAFKYIDINQVNHFIIEESRNIASLLFTVA